MSHRRIVRVVLFLGLSVLAVLNLGDLLGLVGGDRHRAEVERLMERLSELETWEASEAALQVRLERIRVELTEAAVSYMPDPADPFAWVSLQLRYLERASGVRIGVIQGVEAPAIRIRRDEEPRRFSIYRCTAELSGTLEEVLAFIRLAEGRNPYLVVSGLVVGPASGDNPRRVGSVTLDWPAWASPPLREALTTGFSAESE